MIPIYPADRDSGFAPYLSWIGRWIGFSKAELLTAGFPF